MTENDISRPFGDPDADYDPPPLSPLIAAIPAALAGGPIAFFHVRPDLRRAIRRGKIPFFNHLARLLRGRGYGVALTGYYRPPYPRWIGGRSLHVYRGPGKPCRGAGVLHVAKGYLDGYWYLDPLGQRAWSSVGAAEYDPGEVDPALANAIFRELRRRHVRAGHSARDQQPRGAALPEGGIAVFLQGADADAVAPVCTEAGMIRAVVAARGDRPVLIKEHPLGTPAAIRAILSELSGGPVQVVDANIHDLIEASDVVACMSSGVGFEAMLHRTPALVFSRVDYHHGAVTVTGPNAVAEVLETALSRRFHYPKYVWWFMERQLFHQNQPDLDDRLNRVIDAAEGR